MTLNLEYNSNLTQTINLINNYGVPSAPVVPIYYDLTLICDNNGYTEPFNNSSVTYAEGEIVAINANANNGFIFSKWIINNVEYFDKLLYVIMDSDITATAYYIGGGSILYTLDISVTGNGSTSPVEGSYQKVSGDGVLIEAIPDNGSYFESFDINDTLSYSNPMQITMNNNKNVTANFKDYLNVTINNTGNGQVVPSGTTFLKENDELILSAIPNNGSYFKKYIVNGIDSVINPLYLTVTDDVTIECIFKDYLIVDIIDAENGLVSPIGTLNLKENDDLTITATPNSGFTFVNFDVNDILLFSNPLTISITEDVTIVTNFEIIPLPVYYELNISQVGMGTVSPLGCFDNLSGSTTTITATASDSDYTFTNFTVNGVSTTTNPLSITLLENTTVIATFTKIIKWDLDISVVGLGTVSPLGYLSKNDNEQTVITASNTDDDWKFAYWEVNGTGIYGNPLTVTSTENKNVVAIYIKYTKVISVFNTPAIKLQYSRTHYQDSYGSNDIYCYNNNSNLFNGTASYIDTPYRLTGQQPIAVDFEIIPHTTSGARDIFCFGGYAANKKGFHMIQSSTNLLIQMSDGSQYGSRTFDTPDGSLTVSPYNYYYCEYRWNGLSSGLHYLTVNGVRHSAGSTGWISWTGTSADVVRIGAQSATTPSSFYFGQIPYIKVHGGFEYVIGNGVDSDLDTIKDISGNNNHGTLMGAVLTTFWNKVSTATIDWLGIYGATLYTYGSIYLWIPGDNNHSIPNYNRVGYYATGIYKGGSRLYVVPINNNLNTYVPAGIYTWQQLRDLATGAYLTKIEDNYAITELKLKL